MSPRRRRGWAYAGLGVLFGAVGGPAFIASYRHAIDVVTLYGGTSDQELAGWLPLTTDGMLFLVLIVMGLRRVAGQPVGWLPWTAFVSGMVATVSANLAAAPIDPTDWTSGQTIGALAVALWPPVTVVLTLELGSITIAAIQRRFPIEQVETPAPVKAWRPAEPVPAVVTATPPPEQPQPAAPTPPSDDEQADAGYTREQMRSLALGDAARWGEKQIRRGGTAGKKRMLSQYPQLSEHFADLASTEAKRLAEQPAVRAVGSP